MSGVFKFTLTPGPLCVILGEFENVPACSVVDGGAIAFTLLLIRKRILLGVGPSSILVLGDFHD